MKSWHVRIHPDQVRTVIDMDPESTGPAVRDQSQEADVVQILEPGMFCLDCRSASCLHAQYAAQFIADPQRVARWRTILVREDTNNPHAVQKVRDLRDSVRNDHVFARLSAMLGEAARNVVTEEWNRAANSVSRFARSESERQRLQDLASRLYGPAPTSTEPPWNPDYQWNGEPDDTPPGPPAPPKTPFDLIEL
jgi:hypothetical protein